MQYKSFMTSAVLIFALAFMAGCAKPPQQEMDAAKAALEAAKTAEADRYVADKFKAAQDSLDAAMVEVENQNSKFALTRNYGRAQALLQSAVAAANAAAGEAAAAKEAARTAAEGLTQQLQTSIASAKELLTKAPKGKEGRAALEMIQNDIAGVEASLADISTATANGDYLTARDKAQAGLDKINGIIEELNNAISKKASMSR
jgi:hypothetical protein